MKTNWLLLLLLSIASTILPMEETSENAPIIFEQNKEEKYLEDLGLPNQIWAQISF